MAKSKGHSTESDTEAEAEAETHEARSRAGKDDEDGTYVGASGPDDALGVGEAGAEARSRKR